MSNRRMGIVGLIAVVWLGLGGVASAQYQPPPPGPSGPPTLSPPPVTPPVVPIVAPAVISRPPAVAPAEVERVAPPAVEDVEVSRFAVTGSGVTMPALAAALALLGIGSAAVVSARRRSRGPA